METRILVSTAVSGGSLRSLLGEALRRYGAARLAVGVELVRMDFPLPCRSGTGTSLSGDELSRLRAGCGGASVFFSTPLCAKYFTYRAGESYHFVLFDDEETLRRKAALARELGISNVFLLQHAMLG